MKCKKLISGIVAIMLVAVLAFGSPLPQSAHRPTTAQTSR